VGGGACQQQQAAGEQKWIELLPSPSLNYSRAQAAQKVQGARAVQVQEVQVQGARAVQVVVGGASVAARLPTSIMLSMPIATVKRTGAGFASRGTE
jgi:hypothetical protein